MHPSDRGKLLARLGALIARDAEGFARVEVQDNGRLFAEIHAQLHSIPECFHYYGGLADKIEGAAPRQARYACLYASRDPWGNYRDHAMEFAIDVVGLEACSRANGG